MNAPTRQFSYDNIERKIMSISYQTTAMFLIINLVFTCGFASDNVVPVVNGEQAPKDRPTIIPADRLSKSKIDKIVPVVLMNEDNNTKPSRLNEFSNAIDSQMEELLIIADLVFYGEIIAVDFDKTQANKEGYTTPLTYLTFKVTEVIKGLYESDELVLMMPIGWIDEYRYASQSNLPILALGDELIMFLAEGNLNGPVYLSHLFIVDEEIYTDQSRIVVIDESDQLQTGPVVHKNKIAERPLGKGTIRMVRKYSQIQNEVQKNLTGMAKATIARANRVTFRNFARKKIELRSHSSTGSNKKK